MTQQRTGQQSLTLSVAEAAELLGVSRSLMYELIAAGTVPVLRLSTRVRVPRQAIERIVEDAMTMRPAEQPFARPTSAAPAPLSDYPRGRKRTGARA